MFQKELMTFGPVLRGLRVERNWTQAELSEKLGVSFQHVSVLESGRKVPSLLMLFKVAKVFGVTPNSIVAAMEERLR